MIQRILLYVDQSRGMPRAREWTLALARALSARVFAVAIMDPDDARPAATGTNDVEERAWERLYEVEDDAFGQDVKVSLLLEQGDALQRILKLSANYEIELIVASGDTRLALPDLVRHAARPVVFVK